MSTLKNCIIQKDIDFLKQEVKKRRSQRESIRNKIDAYVLKKFGIKQYSFIVDSFLGQLNGELKICLCRQITTANIEHVAVQVFAEWLSDLGLPAKASFMSFTEDSFSYCNPYKKSLVHIPWLRRRKKGNCELFIQNEKVLPKKAGDINGMILGRITTKNDCVLPEFHENICTELLNKPFHCVDTSEMFSSCFRDSVQSGGMVPDFFYVTDENKEKKVPLSAGINGSKVRPPANWFYHLHLLSFLDGQRALISQIGDDAKMSRCFSEPIKEIVKEIGVEPLIVDTPYKVRAEKYLSNLNEINVALSEFNGRKFVANNKNLFATMEEIEKTLLIFS